MNDKKNWEEYTLEEKTTLLNHWFYYYGGIIMTLKDISDFRQISSTRQDDIFNHIVTSFLFQNTIKSNLLLVCMREGKLDELFSHSLTKDKLREETYEEFERVRRMLSNELLSTFIDPAPAVPMDIEIVVEENPKKR